MRNELAVPEQFWTEERKALAHKLWAKDCTAEEFEMFMMVCARTRLDPFMKQLIPVVRRRWNPDRKDYEKFMVITTPLDALCVVAERTGKYEGTSEPEWCGPDEVWKKVWVAKEMPVACRIFVYKKDSQFPTPGIVYYDALCQRKKGQNGQEGEPTDFWQGKKGVSQLEKCALAKALRRAFPQDAGKLYIHEEMEQADSPGAEEKRQAQIEVKEFIETIPPEVVNRAGTLGFETVAKLKSLCAEAGNSREGLLTQLDAVDLFERLDDKVKNQMRSLGYRNRAEARRLIVKHGNSVEKLTAFLDGRGE